jgi:hypothetical protein
MNQGVRAMAGMWYASLIKEFGLDDEERDYFLDLIGAGFGRQQELGMRMMGAKDAAEREAIAKELEAANREQNEAVKAFLNNEEDAKRFLAYQERLGEYQQLDGLRASLKQANAPLRPEQEASLVEAMYRARTSTPASQQWQGGAAGMEALARGDAQQEFERYWEQASRRSLEEVGKVLQGEQLAAYRAYLDQVKEMQLLGLKMAGQMFRKEEPPDP